MVKPIYFLLFLCLSLIGYANSLTNEFLLDDYIILFGPNGVADKSLIKLLTTYSGDFYYRPVGNILLWISCQLFDHNVIYYHLLNLILLSILCYLFYVITLRLTHNNALAVLTSVLYCLHPINNMSVNFITASLTSVYVISLQLSFLTFIHFYENKKKAGFYVLSLLFCVMGLLSHETSVTFPLFIVAYLFFLSTKNTKKGSLSFLFSCPYFFLVAVYLLCRQSIFGKGNAALKISYFFSDFVQNVSILADLITWYVTKLIYPKNILLIWNVDVIPHYLIITLLGVIGIITVLIWLIFFKLRKELAAFGLAILFIGFFPLCISAFAYYPQTKPIIGAHWFYFSSYGFFLLMAMGLLKIYDKGHKFIGLFVITSILVGYFFLLRVENSRWRNQETYCRYWLSLNKLNLTPYYGLGKSLLDQGNYARARHYFREGIKVSKIYNAIILSDLGFAELKLGKYTDAMHYFKLVLKMDPNYPENHYYLSKYYLQRGHKKQAMQEIYQAMALYPSERKYKKFLQEILNE